MTIFPLVDTTEPRYGEIARLMAATGDWITPWFEPGVPFWGKPPLSFWAQALAIRAFGLTEFALRFPSWLCMLATVALIWRYTLEISGYRTARWCALILSSMALTYVASGAVMTDPFLALGTTLSLVSFGMVIAGRVDNWRWLFFLGIAIGLLAKGPLAVVLTGFPMALWLSCRARWHFYGRSLPWVRGTLLTLAITLPWYIAAELKTPGFLDYFIVGEHIRRFLDPGWAGDLYGSAHDQPKGMIWIFWLWASFPWGVLGLAGLVTVAVKGQAGRLRRHLSGDKYSQFALMCALSPMLFFTLAGNTLWTYILPSLPFSALLIAEAVNAWQVRLTRTRRNVGRALIPATLATPVLLSAFALVAVTNQQELKTEEGVASYYFSQRQPGDSALLYLDKLPFSAQFYSRGTANEVTLEELLDMHQNQAFQRYFVAVPRDEENRVLAKLPVSPRIGAENQRYVLLQFEDPKVPTEG
ncbi:ArnT family glycosyltransferase [Marinobacter fonticola]|uniref:ArnT family glycosyltransferase n=1 Tax=Marinobacter fonticola TaxID=2603215 RepID=UPI001D0DBB94|nr:glycosyltransferase family 39 protein [Marinobacter fonticola]